MEHVRQLLLDQFEISYNCINLPIAGLVYFIEHFPRVSMLSLRMKTNEGDGEGNYRGELPIACIPR